MKPTEIKDFSTEGLRDDLIYIADYIDEHPWTSKSGRKLTTMYFMFNGETWQIVDFKVKTKFEINNEKSKFHFKPKGTDGMEVVRVE